jgi:hypothetical protein
VDEATLLVVDLYDLSEDADLYVRHGCKPNLLDWDCYELVGGTFPEQCVVQPPAACRWWVGIVNWTTGPITYKVRATWSNNLIFSDDFETGNPDAWSHVEGK